MRNTLKTLVALLIVFSAAKVSASMDSAATAAFCRVVAQDKEDSYKLIYKGFEEGDVTIKWLDSDRNVIYMENVKSADGFVKQYDLSTLPDGQYSISVQSNGYDFTEEIKLGDVSDFSFNIQGTGNRSVVMTGTRPEGKDVYLHILDEQNNTIYSESLDDSKDVQKKFDFQKVGGESVTFLLYHRDKVFKQESIDF